jgi:ISXO2-like transposase domain
MSNELQNKVLQDEEGPCLVRAPSVAGRAGLQPLRDRKQRDRHRWPSWPLPVQRKRLPQAVTVMTGTLFERSHIPLHKWLLAAFLMCASKKGISTHQLHRMIGVSYKSTWFMTHRIREAIVAPNPGFSDQPQVSADDGRRRPVLSCWQRFARHEKINHSADEYVRGDAHTNTIEGYFSILKRGIIGTYHHVSQQHLKRYLAEFDFRYNERSALGVNDKERAARLLKGIVGKRLTYRRPDETAHD